MRELEIDDTFYANRGRAFDEVQPWDHLSVGVKKEFLLREWNAAIKESLTEDCRLGNCSACGVCPGLAVEIIDGRRSS